MKVKVWLDSGANIHSCYQQIVDTEELGYSDEEWEDLPEEEKEDVMKELAFGRSDWGWSVLK